MFNYYFQDTPHWMFFVKSLCSAYSILWLWQINGMSFLSCLALTGGLAAFGVFLFYFYLSLQGQTSPDRSRRIERVPPGHPKYSYQTLESFLGPNPILRILWPFARLKSGHHYTLINDDESRTIKIM
jgi:hypothetical protein